MKYTNTFDIVSKLQQMEHSGLIDEFDDILFEIITAPGIDIVFCKDCKYRYANVSGIYCRQHSVEVEPDFYCGDGEEGDKE